MKIRQNDVGLCAQRQGKWYFHRAWGTSGLANDKDPAQVLADFAGQRPCMANVCMASAAKKPIG
jgi:hypothetical protein